MAIQQPFEFVDFHVSPENGGRIGRLRERGMIVTPHLDYSPFDDRDALTDSATASIDLEEGQMKRRPIMKPSKNVRDVFRAKQIADLISLLETGEPGEQERASFELGRRGARGALALLRKRLNAPDPNVRGAAVQAVGQIGDAESGPELLKLFRDPKQPDNVRDTCAYSLALLRYRPAVPDLLSALSDPSPSVRLCVVAALAAIDDPRAAQPLRLAKETEPDSAVREEIRKTLAAMLKRSARSLATVSSSRR